MCFSHIICDLWFVMEHFSSWVFYAWTCTHFLPLIMVCIHLKCYITNDVHFIMCVFMWKEMIEKFNEPKIERCNIIFNVFPMYFCFWFKTYFDMCFDNLTKIYASHHYYVTQPIWLIHLQACFKWEMYLCFKGEKNT